MSSDSSNMSYGRQLKRFFNYTLEIMQELDLMVNVDEMTKNQT